MFLCLYVSVSVHVSMRVCVRTFVNVCVSVTTSVCLCVCLSVRLSVCVCVCSYMCVCEKERGGGNSKLSNDLSFKLGIGSDIAALRAVQFFLSCFYLSDLLNFSFFPLVFLQHQSKCVS